MKTRNRLSVLVALTAVGFTCACGVSETEDASTFPSRTIEVVVPYPPGGGSDVLARALVDEINASGDLDADMQIINREGGAGVVGVGETLSADADGYTVVVAPEGPITLQPQVTDVSYEPLDLTPIAQVTRGPVVIAVPDDSPFKSMDDLVAAARKSPGTVTLGEGPLSYAVPAAQIEQMEDVSFRHVDYEGDAASTTALLGANVDAAFTQISGILSQVKSGSLRVLAVGSPERSTFMPEVPTFKEAGIDIEATAVYAVFGPAGIPSDVADVLTEAFTTAMASPKFEKVAETAGLPIQPAEGDELMTYFTDRSAEVQDVIESAGGSL
ncbi:tripartite tricarboxylate transporter substrate binding protein [Aeromicrobium sp.]|uniref:Bug family tripartite tricarboxylate transporter substrate binding protein n=1 Tax=Aeromicrobium sp. TaxID=1871063 RepID=UPI0028AC2B7B|nr:tripartite tricarboxylate transporter substrate binding protein [Aeromicrobium sp.]